MLVNKIVENVEYYVITDVESPEGFVFNEDGKIEKIIFPPEIKAMREDYVFVYVGSMRAHPNHDYTIVDSTIMFTNPMTVEGGITLKLYVKHDGYPSKIDMEI